MKEVVSLYPVVPPVPRSAANPLEVKKSNLMIPGGEALLAGMIELTLKLKVKILKSPADLEIDSTEK